MPNNTVPAAGEAMPKTDPDAIVSAMRNLERDIREVTHMSDITAEALDNLFEHPTERLEGSLVFRLTDHEIDQLAFLINDVAGRCTHLSKRFAAAWDGEQLQ